MPPLSGTGPLSAPDVMTARWERMMGEIVGVPETGVIVGRAMCVGDEEKIAVAVTLSAAQWDELTAWLIGFDRWTLENEQQVHLSLEERIALFVEMETREWAVRGAGDVSLGGDLDNGVPF